MGFLTGFEFRTLIAPCDNAAFFNEHWNQQPLVESRALPGFYDGLLTLANIDAVLAINSQNRVAEDHGELDIDAALRRLEQGASLVLSQAQRQISSLAHICRTLQAELGFRTYTDLEVTMPVNKPRAAETNAGHRFVLQLRGSREWLIGDNATAEPVSQAVLSTGDLLYIPPGHVTQHRTTGDDSIIATITLNTPRWVDVTGNRALADDPTLPELLAEPLPPRWIHIPRTDLLAELSRRWRQAEDIAVVEAALTQMIGQEVRNFPLDLRGRLSAVLDPREIDETTRFGARRDLLWVIEDHNDAERLIAGPLTLDLGENTRAAVEFCLSTESYSVSDLPDSVSPADRHALLDRLSRDMLIRRLSR